MRLWSVFRKSAREQWRDPLTLCLVLIFAPSVVLLYRLFFPTGSTTYTVLILNQDRGTQQAAGQLWNAGDALVAELKKVTYADGSPMLVVERVAKETQKKYGVKVRYMIGTMIEIPRACLAAGEIASQAEFFSFGTNDLTQTVLALSRDDAGKFLPGYVDRKIYKEDPFVSIDQEGVGEMMRMGVERGRKVRKDLELGICGEHGGDPASVIFCHQIGLDYVSCSPYRIPVAKLAAAHANLKGKVKVKEMGEK